MPLTLSVFRLTTIQPLWSRTIQSNPRATGWSPRTGESSFRHGRVRRFYGRQAAQRPNRGDDQGPGDGWLLVRRVRRGHLRFDAHSWARWAASPSTPRSSAWPLPRTAVGTGWWPLTGESSTSATRFRGSMGGKPLNAAIVGMACDPDGGGYWLVAADGGSSASETPPSRGRWAASH